MLLPGVSYIIFFCKSKAIACFGWGFGPQNLLLAHNSGIQI